MKILVCIKIVSQMSFADTLENGVDRFSAGQLDINPADMHALECALRIKDKSPDTFVTVMTMAPAEIGEYYLRKTLAMGADEALLISDVRAASSDTIATSRILSSAVRYLPQQDLILCGNRAIDSETGHVGPQLAVNCGLEICTNVVEFKSCGSGSFFSVSRAQDNGMAEYEGSFPALLTICVGAYAPRSATISGMRAARDKNIRVVGLDELGIAPALAGSVGSPTKNVEMHKVHFRKCSGEKISSAAKGAELIGRLLAPDRNGGNLAE